MREDVPAWPPGASSLHHDRPQSLGRAVDGGGQAGRPRPDDHRVVLRCRRLGRDVEELGHSPELRSHDGLAVYDAKSREVALGRQRARPLLCIGGHVRLEPSEPDLVPLEEVPQLRAGGIPPMAEDERPERGRCRRTGLQALGPPEPVERSEAHALPDLRRGSDERLVIVQLEPEYARRLHGLEPAGVEHSEGDRHLPEDVTGLPLSDHAFHAVDTPQHLDSTRQKRRTAPARHPRVPRTRRERA